MTTILHQKQKHLPNLCQLELALSSQGSLQIIKRMAVLDTGFSGYLAISKKEAQKLGLPKIGEATTIVANNSTVNSDIYKGKVSFMSLALEADFIIPINTYDKNIDWCCGLKLINLFATRNHARFVIDFEKLVLSFETPAN